MAGIVAGTLGRRLIAFGSAITKPDEYRRAAAPGIALAAEPGAQIYDLESVGSLAASYNRVLDLAAARDDLEALVMVHQDTEIVTPGFCTKVRAALRDPEVGVVGCVGAIGVRSIAWWEGSVTLASFVNRYAEHGGGELAAFSWDWDDAPPYAQVGEVETLDGFLLVLSPWAVRTVRFDETLTQFHGYDLDYCLQVREAGRKVMTADVRAIHHRPLEMVPDQERWVAAHIEIAEKWDGRMPGIGTAPGSWRDRALRAEAERDAAWALAHQTTLELKARRARLERDIAETRGSVSWRATAPLRRLGKRAS
jgi:hypothetical protein